MPPSLGEQSLYLVHLFSHLPVQGMGDVMALLVQLMLHLMDTRFNARLRVLNLLDCLVNLIHLLLHGGLVSLNLAELLFQSADSGLKCINFHWNVRVTLRQLGGDGRHDSFLDIAFQCCHSGCRQRGRWVMAGRLLLRSVRLLPWVIGNPWIHVSCALEVLHCAPGCYDGVRHSGLKLFFFMEFTDEDVPMLQNVNPVTWVRCGLDGPLHSIPILAASTWLQWTGFPLPGFQQLGNGFFGGTVRQRA